MVIFDQKGDNQMFTVWQTTRSFRKLKVSFRPFQVFKIYRIHRNVAKKKEFFFLHYFPDILNSKLRLSYIMHQYKL